MPDQCQDKATFDIWFCLGIGQAKLWYEGTDINNSFVFFNSNTGCLNLNVIEFAPSFLEEITLDQNVKPSSRLWLYKQEARHVLS